MYEKAHFSTTWKIYYLPQDLPIVKNKINGVFENYKWALFVIMNTSHSLADTFYVG